MKINVYVNGEEICKLVRDLFWVENLEYEECEKILMEWGFLMMWLFHTPTKKSISKE